MECMSKGWTKQMRISMAGHCPFEKKNKKENKIAGMSEGQKELELNEMSYVGSTLKQLLLWSM
jgi:hypothetical protein